MKSQLRTILINLLLLTVGAIVVDLGVRLIGVRPDTMDPTILRVPLGVERFGRFAYPRGYFAANEKRGFDIALDVPPTEFEYAEGRIQIFSNKYGCFDRTTSFDGPYVLLVGDSFTWGYADYDAKWGTLLERKLGMPVAKCGVTHTGQRHQLSKAIDVAAAIGHPPKLVVVGHYHNDDDDDLLFPRATVIEGYLADATILEGGVPRHYTRDELEERYRRWAAGDLSMKNIALGWTPPSVLERHSVIFAGIRRLRAERGASARKYGKKSSAQCAAEAQKANEDAMDALKTWVDSIGAELRVVFVPSQKERRDRYDSMRKHLDQAKIPYLDLVPRFNEVPNSAERLFGRRDVHWNVEGNRLAAELVAPWLAAALGQRP